MRIKKKIFAMLMMLCMVLQMLPNTVLAETVETISGEGNTYIGPTRICPNRDLKFSFKTDNVGPDGRDAWIGGIDKIDETYLSVYSEGDTWSAVISKNGIQKAYQKAYSQSSSFSIRIFSNTVSTLRQLNITINISHIDDNFDHKCDDCGEKISDHIDNDGDHYCDTCKVRVSCSGGVATCTDKAICATCGQSYGEVDPTNHVGGIESHNAKAATCTEDGYEAYWECKNCGHFFSDEAGTVQITEPVKIAASGHKDDNKDHSCDVCGVEVGEHNDTDHDHKCDYGCTVPIGDHKAGEGKHTCDYCGAVMSKCSGGTATCKDKAICEICGKPYGEKDPTNHVGGTEIRDSKAAICTEDGYEGDTYCTSCDTKLLSGEPIAASGHKDDNKDHSCDVCGAEVGKHIDVDHDHKCDYGCTVPIGDHKAGEGKHICDYCGAVMSKCSGGTATCKDKAICEICGKPYGEKDPTNHVGDTEVRDAKAATCTENGYEGDIYCKDCGVKLSSGEPIVAFGHTYKDEVTKEATTESAGIRTYTCEKCGDFYTEEIAKLPAKPEPTKPSKPENRVEPTKPSKPENRVEPSKPTEPQKQIEPLKTVNQISLIEILIAMFVNGIAVPSMQLITSIWQLILQFIKMLLTAAF